jgi:hypothetical protein
LAVYILKGLIYGAIDFRSERKQPASPTLQEPRDTLGPQPSIAVQRSSRTFETVAAQVKVLRFES